ncbi:MAG: S8 family serine peptidase, partial [Actinomycetia bacterium]|nr:S8 family serine peptidase [Actinomycetes bacterium]
FIAAAALLMVVALTPAGASPSPSTSVGLIGPSSVDFLTGADQTNPIELPRVADDVLERFAEESSDGSGIDVALIDTGVAPVAGLDGPDKVLHGPDLSFEGQSPEAAYLDTFGHGTHMAGIIAGDRQGQEGIAPGARIVSVKVAGHDGVTTVPQVVAAIDWVVEHRNSDGLNIRVLNLSLGQAGISTHSGDSLSAAVERAWDAGIFVVVAAGNRGSTQGHLDSPAIDPYVLAVGASDDTTGLDEENQPVPAWSSRGSKSRKPDLVAPGRSIASYRVPGSTADVANPSARYGNDLFIGSGTSQAAAVTSGVAARMFDHYPYMDANELKQSLTDEADTDLGYSRKIIGNGVIDAEDSWESPQFGVNTPSHPRATGSGTGLTAPTGSTWSGGTWSGSTWSGSTWSGSTWSGGTWSGATWSGSTWSGTTWSGATWSGGTWSGATWSGATWSGTTWSGATWSGNGWS